MRSIDELTTVHLGGVRQWLRIMGSDLRNPILLLVPQGPGLPMIHEARRLERTLHLKDDFTVVYWDLRGCGLSLRDDNGAIDLNMDRLTTDVVELVDHLTTRFEQPTIVTGFSQGGTLALRAAARRPDLITAVVAVGPDIDGPTAERSAYHFALATARARRNRRALRALEGIGPPPHLTARQFRTRVRWVTNFGGVRLGATYRSIATSFIADIIKSPDYTAADLVRILRQLPRTQHAMLPELVSLDLVRDLPEINTSVVIVQGRRDQVAPPEAAARFVTTLTAPTKRVAWFDHSAHMPHYEEPGPFRNLLADVRSTCQQQPASG